MMTWNELLSRLSGRVVEFADCPPEDCAGPDGTFPIRKQQDVYDAAKHLEGHPQAEKIKKNIKKIAKRKGFRLPQELQDTHSDMAVETTLEDEAEATFDAGYVFKTGKIFECGEWEDKDFSFDETDADHAVATFVPVELDIEHRPSLLDGKMGMVQRIWRKGKELFASVKIDQRLASLLGDTPIRVSCTWDRTTKTLHRLALTTNPRIEDAVLMAAFADNTTPSPVAPEVGRDKETPSMPTLWEDIKAVLFKRGIEVKEDESPMTPEPEKTDPKSEFKVEETEEFKALQAELTKQRELAEAQFKVSNEQAIDRLIAEFKVEPAQKEKYLALRKDSPVQFDAIMKDQKPLAHLVGKEDLDASTVLNQLNGDPEKAAMFQADLKGLVSRGLYQPF